MKPSHDIQISVGMSRYVYRELVDQLRGRLKTKEETERLSDYTALYQKLIGKLNDVVFRWREESSDMHNAIEKGGERPRTCASTPEANLLSEHAAIIEKLTTGGGLDV